MSGANLQEIDRLDPQAIIVDSVQTVFSMKLESAPGSVSQVREVAGQFLMLAKNRTVPVFLIGHVTKDGAMAGPKHSNTLSIRCFISKANAITIIASFAR